MSLPTLALLAAALLAFAAGLRQLRGWRFARVEREFYARWLALPELRKRRALAAVAREPGSLGRIASHAQGIRPDAVIARVVEERWRLMRRARDYDFVKLREELDRLLARSL